MSKIITKTSIMAMAIMLSANSYGAEFDPKEEGHSMYSRLDFILGDSEETLKKSREKWAEMEARWRKSEEEWQQSIEQMKKKQDERNQRLAEQRARVLAKIYTTTPISDLESSDTKAATTGLGYDEIEKRVESSLHTQDRHISKELLIGAIQEEFGSNYKVHSGRERYRRSWS